VDLVTLPCLVLHTSYVTQLTHAAFHRSLPSPSSSSRKDYDRLKFSSRESQITHFTSQLTLSQIHNLPLFLHSRAAGDDFLSIMKAHRSLWKGQGGVVHSFTGTLEEMRGLVEEGLYVGINGCSLKTEENLEAVKELPLERLMLETGTLRSLLSCFSICVFFDIGPQEPS
jgi:hypothetical protein